MAKEVKESKEAPVGFEYVTYLKDGAKAKKGETIMVSTERATVLRELEYIK